MAVQIRDGNSDRRQKLIPVSATRYTERYPRWYSGIAAIAERAYQSLSGGCQWTDFPTPAFTWLSDSEPLIAFDGSILPDCLDSEFLSRVGLTDGAAIVGVTSDKDGPRLVSALRQAGFRQVYAVSLTSAIGHIDSTWLDSYPEIEVLTTIDVVRGGSNELRVLVVELAEKMGALYCVGAQLFIRSLRQAFGRSILGHRSDTPS